MSDRLFFVDIETTGLDADFDLLLEVGFAVTDAELNVLDTFSTTVWSPLHNTKMWTMKADLKSEFVYTMHDDEHSGLWKDAKACNVSPERAQQDCVEWLKGEGISNDRVTGDPMCGSSVHFDRRFLAVRMPELESLFHYRNIDTSSVKELCRRFNPEVYEKLSVITSPKKLHRALPDLEDTIDELRFYRDNFLFTTIGEPK